MAIGAGGVDGLVVQADPICVEVQFGFGAAADLNVGGEILLVCNDGNGMAEITFEANRLILIVQMLAIVTSETAW